MYLVDYNTLILEFQLQIDRFEAFKGSSLYIKQAENYKKEVILSKIFINLVLIAFNLVVKD